MIRRLPEILSMITVCFLVVLAAGCPMEPPENNMKDDISEPASAIEPPSPQQTSYHPVVRAAQPSADSPIGCVRDDR